MLSTIQKREKLNEVYTLDEKGPGEAYHKYIIYRDELVDPVTLEHQCTPMATIQFQKGPRNEKESINGVIDSDLLEIVRHRLECFQAGPYNCRENALALTHIETALMWLNRRVEDRIERQVIGTNTK